MKPVIRPNISLSSFKSKIRDVARPNRFFVRFDVPTKLVSLADTWFLSNDIGYFVKSVSLPGRVMTTVEVPHLGMTQKIQGDPKFEDVNVTFLCDAGWRVRNIMERWMECIHTGTSAEGIEIAAESPGVYLDSDMEIVHLGRGNNSIARQFLHQVFPTAMTEVELNQESMSVAEEFTVTFSYGYWSKGQGILTSLANFLTGAF